MSEFPPSPTPHDENVTPEQLEQAEQPEQLEQAHPGTPELGAPAEQREDEVWQHPTLLTVWRKLFSPLLVFAAAVWAFLQNAGSDKEIADVWGWLIGLGMLAVLVVVPVVLVAALISTAWAYVVWRHTRFAFLSDGIHIVSGVFVKKREQVRWARIQTMEITQDFLAQVCRQGTLSIETLGSDPSIKIGLLRLSELEVLRVELLAFASRARAGEEITEADCERLLATRRMSQTEGTGVSTHVDDVRAELQPLKRHPSAAIGTDGGQEPLFVQSLPQSFIAAFLDASTIAPAIAAIVCFVGLGMWEGEGIGTFVGVAFVAGAIAGVGQRINAVWNLRVYASDGGSLRVRVGGAGTSARMILPGRVTTVKIVQPLLYRPLKLWRLDVYTLAGLNEAMEEVTQKKTSHVIPAGRYEQVRELALYLLRAMDVDFAQELELGADCQGDGRPGLELGADCQGEGGAVPGLSEQRELNEEFYDFVVAGDSAGLAHEEAVAVRSSLEGKAVELGCFYRASRRARWWSPFAYKREGIVLFEQCVATRGGWLRRKASVARLERLQSMRVHAGPIDRALGIASATAHFTIPDSNVRFNHGDRALVEAIAIDLAELARRAQLRERLKS